MAALVLGMNEKMAVGQSYTITFGVSRLRTLTTSESGFYAGLLPAVSPYAVLEKVSFNWLSGEINVVIQPLTAGGTPSSWAVYLAQKLAAVDDASYTFLKATSGYAASMTPTDIPGMVASSIAEVPKAAASGLGIGLVLVAAGFLIFFGGNKR